MPFIFKRVFPLVLALPRSIWFNFRYLPFREAIKLPVLISNRVRVAEMHRGNIHISPKCRRFGVKIGFGGAEVLQNNRGKLVIRKQGHVTFGNNILIGEGTCIQSSGELTIGDGFYCNKNCLIWSSKAVDIGDDCLMGWNAVIRDTDGHTVDDKPNTLPITIGNHCWIATGATVMKGVHISNGSIVGWNAVVTHSVHEENVLLGGVPAVVKRKNVRWNH